jgi:hypothetical protein
LTIKGISGAVVLLPWLLLLLAFSKAAGRATGAMANPWWLAAHSLRSSAAGLLVLALLLLLSGR